MASTAMVGCLVRPDPLCGNLMRSATSLIRRMDCSAEAQLVRMRVEDVESVESIQIDLDAPTVTVSTTQIVTSFWERSTTSTSTQRRCLMTSLLARRLEATPTAASAASSLLL